MAKKKAHRTTLRSSSGKKLYAVRDAEGQFKDIQSYKRAQGQDIQRTSKAETAARGAATATNEPKSNVSLPGVSLPIPTPGVASQASPLTIPNLGGGKKKQSSKPAPAAKSAAKKAPAKPAVKKGKPAAKPAAKKAAKPAPKKKKKR